MNTAAPGGVETTLSTTGLATSATGLGASPPASKLISLSAKPAFDTLTVYFLPFSRPRKVIGVVPDWFSPTSSAIAPGGTASTTTSRPGLTGGVTAGCSTGAAAGVGCLSCSATAAGGLPLLSSAVLSSLPLSRRKPPMLATTSTMACLLYTSPSPRD